MEKITGIYIPFWLVNSNVTGEMSARCKRINTWVSGDYRYTKTDVYNVYREVNLNFNNVPHNASSKMDDDVMKYEHIILSELKDFFYSIFTFFQKI